MPAPPLVLLDLDGTLTDSAPGIVSSMQKAMAAVGIPVPDGDLIRTFVGPPMTESLAAYEVPADRVPDVIGAYRAEFEATGMWDSAPFPGVSEQLALLQQQGCILAVATSKPERYARPICERWGLDAYLEGIFGPPDSDAAGTKASVIAIALEALGDRTGPLLMVGDRRQDVDGAAAHGIACLGVGWGYAEPGELDGAAALVDRVDDLAEAVLRQLGG